MEVTISEILARTDSDKNTAHHYGVIYDDIFSRFNRADKLNILEIGIQKGGSLKAWREYFPNAKITGVDIVDNVKEKLDSINYVFEDINEYRTDETFDIVIDDGSHWLKDVVHTATYFNQRMNENGVIIIEDVQRPDVWLITLTNIMSDELEYNKGKPHTITYYDARTSGLSDDFIILIQ